MFTLYLENHSTPRSGKQWAVHCVSSLLPSLLFFSVLAMVQVSELSVLAQESNVTASAQKAEKDIRILEQGRPIERELMGGEVHTYQIMLTLDQFLHLVVDPRGIDVVVTLFGPDGGQFVKADYRLQGNKPVYWIAGAVGSYRLEVGSSEKTASPGRYEVEIKELRKATPQDKNYITAQEAFAEGMQLQMQGTGESLQKAVEKYKDALLIKRALGDLRWEAEILNCIGFVYSLLDEYQSALDYYGQALQLRQAAGDRKGEAITLFHIGNTYYNLSELQKASDYFAQSLQLIRVSGDRKYEADILKSIGSIYDTLGDKQAALEYFNQSLSLIKSLGDTRREAYIYNNIGLVYGSLGELQKALEYYFLSLSLKRALGDHRSEASTLNNIALVYDNSGEYQRALDYLTQALHLFRATGNRRGEAIALGNIGRIYSLRGENQTALEYYDKALLLYRTIGYVQGEAETVTNIGSIYDSLGEKEKALDYFNQALSFFQAVGNQRGKAETLNCIGYVYSSMGKKQKALEYYSQALPLRRIVGDRGGEAQTLYYIACAERDRGNLTEAFTQIEAACKIIEFLRTSVANQQLRASYFATVQEYYEFYIDLLMRLHKTDPSAGHDGAALQASEQGRARSLLELLAEARADIRQGIDPKLVERERSLQQRLNAKAEVLLQIKNVKGKEVKTEATEKEIDALTTEYQEVQSEIRKKSPAYAALTQPQPLSVKEIQQQVLDADTLLLEYSLGKERSYLWMVSQNSIASFELPKREEIENSTRRVYELLATRSTIQRSSKPGNKQVKENSTRLAQANTEYLEAASRLSQMLLGSVASQLDKKRILIVADGILQYLPFAALPVPAMERRPDTEMVKQDNLVPLVVEHEIVSLPSASALAVLRRELAGRTPAAKTIAILADPVFEKDDPRIISRVKNRRSKAIVRKSANRSSSLDTKSQDSDIERSAREVGIADANQHISRLPFTRQEAVSIINLVPDSERKQALDFEASLSMATSNELDQYRLVHFATHGLLNSVHPELSGIVLSLVDQQGRPQDGFLQLHEVYNLKLSAELVVLSACQTGLGKEVKGEGLVGLTRGFMYAGAARVMASLWKVDDRATAELMKRFYQGMLGEKRLSPAAALRAAQIEMWKQKRWESPYYWAAFLLHGEYR
jgi:CHAT domain-containing protein/Tfp pilus assembly protein PilF